MDTKFERLLNNNLFANLFLMITTPERDLAQCEHKDILQIRNQPNYSFCRDCGYGFYKVMWISNLLGICLDQTIQEKCEFNGRNSIPWKRSNPWLRVNIKIPKTVLRCKLF